MHYLSKIEEKISMAFTNREKNWDALYKKKKKKEKKEKKN